MKINSFYAYPTHPEWARLISLFGRLSGCSGPYCLLANWLTDKLSEWDESTAPHRMFVFDFCVTIVTRNAAIHSNKWRKQQANKQTFIAWIWDSQSLTVSWNGRLNLICYHDHEESKWSSWDVVVVVVVGGGLNKVFHQSTSVNIHLFFAFFCIWHHTLLEVSALALRKRDSRKNKVIQIRTECASHRKRWKRNILFWFTFCEAKPRERGK